MGRLDEKNVIITGAGRGIGKAISRKFLQEGARVLICDVVPDRLENTLQELRPLGVVHAMAADVSKASDCEALVKRAVDLFGELNVLINNAGIAILEPFLEQTEAAWDRTMNINLKGIYLLSQQAARVMVAQGKGGAIVNMASTNAHLGERGLTAYNASKAGIVMLTKTMAIELAQYDIRCNCVSPGFIYTELSSEVLHEGFIKAYVDKIPMGRYGRPDEVANLYAFLASDEASFITGDSVIIDGGQISEE